MTDKSHLRISDPTIVSYSSEGETRWGYHQFPALSRLPDGRILLVYADAEDASESHGEVAPAFVSSDGTTWSPFVGPPHPVRPHFSVTPLGGRSLVLPSAPYFDTARHGIELPPPVANSEVYGTLLTYRADELPEAIRDDLGILHGAQFADGKWSDIDVRYDMKGRLAWRREGSTLLPRPFFERSALVSKNEILYPDYRVRFELPDGRIAPKGSTWLMASTDAGMSFQKRGLVATDPSGHDLYGEPTIAETKNGGLVCVIRRTDQVQKPMAITWSGDGGRTWTPAVDLFEFGVFPCLLRLESGPLLLSYGRPGVYVTVNASGDGRVWETPHAIIRGDRTNVSRQSCGYTSLLALDPNRALIAYSDFLTPGKPTHRKAICVRIVEVE